MSTLAERVAECLEETKNTPGSVAGHLGIKAPSVYDWLNGNTKNLAGMNLLKASELFGVNPEWLQSGRPPKYLSAQKKKTHISGEPESIYNIRPAPPVKKPVPVLTLIQAGNMKEIGYLPEPGEGDRWEAPDHKLGAKGFCLIVEGWSMWDGTDDGIKDGDLIFCDPEISPGPNDLVIAKNVGDQSATFKQLSYEDGSWYLRPLNKDPIYQSKKIDDPAIRVIAVVTEYRRPSKKLR
jgi:SOS-response transcriptional repressor LexA